MLTFKWNAIMKNEVLKDIPQFNADGTENSFRLVQDMDHFKELRRFQLICIEDDKAHLEVDLETGYFIIRGAPFHPYISLKPLNPHYRIVFYRRMRALGETLIYGKKPEEAGDLDEAGEEWQFAGEKGYWGWIKNKTLLTPPEIHRFLLGWQCTINGKNYQKIIFYDPKTANIEIKGKR